jgi:TonB-dependent Receptor Plug Domain.
MKRIILISLCLFLGTLALSAQQTLYVIDNETVENFDGSQLKGKVIKEYKITTKGTGRNGITVHSITTARPSSPRSFRGRPLTFSVDSTLISKDIKVFYEKDRKVVYVIDGVKHNDATALKKIPPENISSIKVLKDGSPEQMKYGKDVAVIEITTKAGDNVTVNYGN